MAESIFEHVRPIPRELLSDMMQGDKGEAALQVRAYYYKDSRRWGLKLSISRVLVTEWGFSYDMMNRHNGLVHLADMDCKPSPKVAAEWAARIRAEIDNVTKIALASNAPDWLQIAALFAELPA
jgi:hypothetical protein